MNKIPVAILGATGSVGQKFIQLLENHPWFEIKALGASPRSAGKPYEEAAKWFMNTPIPENIRSLTIRNCTPEEINDCQIIFSGLDASVAGEIETNFAQAGHTVVSNSKNHRFDPDVPLLIPEVNSQHLSLLKAQTFSTKDLNTCSLQPCIVTNPNCSTVGLVLALKPLHDKFGIEQIHVTTLQALSGAGQGMYDLDTEDNIIPHIGGEEEKIETEPLKILGTLENKQITPADIKISASCNRVGVIDGHTESVSVKFTNPPTNPEEIITTWTTFRAAPQDLNLPSAPKQPIHYHSDPAHPQPKLHRNLEKGMAVSIGRLRPCNLFDYKFTLLAHNTIRGAAGGAILNAELMLKNKKLPLIPNS